MPLPDLVSQLPYDPQHLQLKTLLEREHQKTTLLAFSAGQELQEHQARHDVLVIPVEGICNFRLAQTWQRLQVGQVYKIPANEPHALQAVTDFKMVLIR